MALGLRVGIIRLIVTGRLQGLGFFGGPGAFSGWTAFRVRMWEFPRIRGTLFGGPYNKDPTI